VNQNQGLDYDEAIVSRNAYRPGCTFIGYTKVGISVYLMTLRALIIKQTEIQPIEEYIIKLLNTEINEIDQIVNILGISKDIIEDKLIELRRNEYIDIAQKNNSDEVKCYLTEAGKELSKTLLQNTMQEVSIPKVIFHGMLRKTVGLGEFDKRKYFKPKEAKEKGLTLIPGLPNRYPYPEEIDVNTLNKVIQRSLKKKQLRREAVSVKSILKMVYTLYEPAILLQYVTNDSRKERQIAFAINGKVDEQYERAFSSAEGFKLHGELLGGIPETFKNRIERTVPSKILPTLGKLDDIEKLTVNVAVAKQRFDDATTEYRTIDNSDTREILKDEIDGLRRELEEAIEERDSRPVKYLLTRDIKEKFWEAITTSTQRLLILSGFISSAVVNKEFQNEICTALSRGVQIWIGYGFGKDGSRGRKTRSGQKWQEAEKVFQNILSQYPNSFIYKDIGRSHEKRVICDYKFALGGSFNFLSFTGEAWGNNDVRHEGGDLIESKEFCKELYDRYLQMFFRE